MPRGIPGSGPHAGVTRQEEADIDAAVERVKQARRVNQQARRVNPGYEPLPKGSYAERLDNARRTLKHMRENLDDILMLVLGLQESRSLALLDSETNGEPQKKRRRRRKNSDVSASDGRKKGRGKKKHATEKL